MAFNFQDSIDVGIKIKDETFYNDTLNENFIIDNVRIFNCFEGRCEITAGYIMYLNKATNSFKMAQCLFNCKPFTKYENQFNCMTNSYSFYKPNYRNLDYCIWTKDSGEYVTYDIITQNESFKIMIPTDNKRTFPLPIDRYGSIVGHSKSKE